jgi:hypothetical protein
MSQQQDGAGERRVGQPAAQVEPIRVDRAGRYLLVVRPAFCLTPSALSRLQSELPRVEAELQAWWASGKKFGLVVVDPYLQFAVQRAEEESNTGG